ALGAHPEDVVLQLPRRDLALFEIADAPAKGRDAPVEELDLARTLFATQKRGRRVAQRTGLRRHGSDPSKRDASTTRATLTLGLTSREIDQQRRVVAETVAPRAAVTAPHVGSVAQAREERIVDERLVDAKAVA